MVVVLERVCVFGGVCSVQPCVPVPSCGVGVVGVVVKQQQEAEQQQEEGERACEWRGVGSAFWCAAVLLLLRYRRR